MARSALQPPGNRLELLRLVPLAQLQAPPIRFLDGVSSEVPDGGLADHGRLPAPEADLGVQRVPFSDQPPGPAVDRQPERAADVGGRAGELLVAAEVAMEHGGGGP